MAGFESSPPQPWSSTRLIPANTNFIQCFGKYRIFTQLEKCGRNDNKRGVTSLKNVADGSIGVARRNSGMTGCLLPTLDKVC